MRPKEEASVCLLLSKQNSSSNTGFRGETCPGIWALSQLPELVKSGGQGGCSGFDEGGCLL